ncbi:MAG: type VI secretion system contractile sheath large subunit [Acidobacteriales bacterium]|nr:type VI secretion system contractile sheath large subunit [Terriglobales bacterium]
MKEPSEFVSVNLDVNAGAERLPAKPTSDTPFRILLLGDFSGRVNRGATSPDGWKPIQIDRDNFEEVLASTGAELRLGGRQGNPGIALRFRELEDFHPDRIFAQAEAFRTLREIRRELGDPSTFREAAELVKGWTGMPATVPRSVPPPRQERPAPPPNLAALSGGSLLDSVLEGMEDQPDRAERPRDELQAFIEQSVAPHLAPRPNPRLPELIAQVDEAAGNMMRAVLHHKDFQALEAAWRTVFFLVRRLETGTDLKLYLLDTSKAEFDEDLRQSGRPRGSELYRVLAGADPWAVVAGNFSFGRNEEDIRTLTRIGHLMDVLGAPFLAEANLADHSDAVEVTQRWESLRHSPEASWLGLALPRFLLRLPYGKETDPVESFSFEEMPGTPEHQDYLWGNPAFACVELLGEGFSNYGWNLRPGANLEISGLPLHVYESGGEKHLKPCAELLMTESEAEWVLEQGFMPLVSLKDRDAARLLRFQSIAEPLAPLSGRWSQA